MAQDKKRERESTRAEVLDIEKASGRIRVTMVLPQSLWAAIQDCAPKEHSTVPRLIERALSRYVARGPIFLAEAPNLLKNIHDACERNRESRKKVDPPDGDDAA